MTWKIFFHMYMDESKKRMKSLDERFVKLKYMDEISFKTIMLDENHMYMNDSYKKT
jgi:hypothetical protein